MLTLQRSFCLLKVCGVATRDAAVPPWQVLKEGPSVTKAREGSSTARPATPTASAALPAALRSALNFGRFWSKDFSIGGRQKHRRGERKANAREKDCGLLVAGAAGSAAGAGAVARPPVLAAVEAPGRNLISQIRAALKKNTKKPEISEFAPVPHPTRAGRAAKRLYPLPARGPPNCPKGDPRVHFGFFFAQK